MGSLINFKNFRICLEEHGPPQICRSVLLCSMMVASAAAPPCPWNLKVSCGLRNGPRKPLWRKSVLSTEAIQAVQSLKLAAKSSSSSSSSANNKLEEVFTIRLSRLLKADLLDTLTELQRQNQFHLALKVFQFVRKEVWYEPDLSLFCDMMLMLGKNKLIGMAEDLFSELKKEGLEPNTRAYTEMIAVYLKVDMIQKAMETYELMKASGCVPDKLTLTILIRNLEKSGEEELVARVKKECADYINIPESFIEEVGRKNIPLKNLKRRPVNLI